jgi:hypothetical protein
MTDQSDLDYFAARGKAERELSKASTEPIVGATHRMMALCNERLAREAGPPRPSLRTIAA